ncbi:MAG: zinc-binding dehydrogenase [Desulfobacterales bacterium]|jgi:NADPH:quinone reductase-like Zn-dependent oxidoreductase
MLPHKFPIILGWDLAGMIEETGYSVRRFTVGGQNFFIYSQTHRAAANVCRIRCAPGKLKTHLSSVYSLADVQKAHAEMETGHTRGKIVLKVD